MPILINDNTARVQYTATAGQTVFVVPYEFFEVGDLKVYNGNTLLAYNVTPSSASQYSVTGAGVTGGGSITLGAPGAAVSNVITIARDIPIKRLTDFPNAGPFNIQALNAELDKITAVQQNLETDLQGRVFRLSQFDQPNILSALPSKANRQNKLLGFDIQGQPIAYDAASLGTLVAYATAYADTFTGDGIDTTFTLSGDPAVIANLDVSINGVTQVPFTDYTFLGTTLTTTTAVPNGAVMLVKFKEGLPNYSGDAQDIQYTAGFSGAVSQSVETKLEQYVSVKDFGAVGDGVADDTVSIQAALTAAGVNRFALYFPGTDNHYLITDALTVPDGVMVYGDGWTSFIRQTTLNKGAFIAGDCNVFRDIRVKVADGDDSMFVNCIFANNVNNLTVENCFLELGDLGGTGVHIRGVKNSLIRGNRIYGGKYTSGVAAAASAADILLYSSTVSERHIIDNNHCLSNNSQGIYAGALGYDGDIIISNNICVTLDPATCTETGTWSLVASGGDRRHGILVTYSNAQAGIPRTVVTGNICRNTQWTGIYKNDLSQGEIIISNNLCDLNGYDNSTPLSGGIYVEAAGKVIVTGNTVSNYQSTVTGTGAYTINQATAENLPALFSSNKAVGSLGYGLAIGTGARLLYVTDNLFTGNANSDIYVSTNPVATAGGITILNNRIIRSSGNTISALRVDPQSSTRVTIIKGNYITGFDNTNNSNSNAGIFVRSASKLVQVEDNTIENFYRAFFSDEYYSSGRMADRVIQNNVIRNCAIGFDVSAGNNNLNTLPLVGNVFIDTPVQVANTTGFEVGRLVQRLGNNFVWQTTAAPTVGSWLIGDRSVNYTPAVGQPKAWACTVTGAPGTWVSEGNL